MLTAKLALLEQSLSKIVALKQSVNRAVPAIMMGMALLSAVADLVLKPITAHCQPNALSYRPSSKRIAAATVPHLPAGQC